MTRITWKGVSLVGLCSITPGRGEMIAAAASGELAVAVPAPGEPDAAAAGAGLAGAAALAAGLGAGGVLGTGGVLGAGAGLAWATAPGEAAGAADGATGVTAGAIAGWSATRSPPVPNMCAWKTLAAISAPRARTLKTRGEEETQGVF